MEINELPIEAQEIYGALMDAAQVSVNQRGFGYGQVSEDRVGGLGPNPPNPAHFSSDDEGAAAYQAAVEAYTPNRVRVGIDQLRAAGVDVRVSAGESMRMIALPGAKFQAKAS